MHIAVQHGIDKINSMHSDLLLPEEIDLELNKNILRFVHSRFNPRGNRYQKGFEMSQKRIDDLRPLVVESSTPAIYKGNVFDNTWVDAGFLPDDYLTLLNLKCLVRQDKCKKICWSEIMAQMRPINYTLDSNLSNHTTLGGLNSATFVSYIGAYIGYMAPGGSLPALNPLVAAYPGVPNTAAGFKAWCLNPANWSPGVSFSGAGGTNITITTSLGFSQAISLLGVVFFNTGNSPGSSTLSDDGGGLGNPANGGAFSATAYWSEKRVPCEDQDYTQTVGVNKFTQHDDIYTLLQDPFNKTTFKSPMYTAKENYVEIYTDDTFIVDSIRFTYLKNPQEVDAGNNIDCDLPNHTHQEIVDMTVATILEAISDPRYQSASMEMLKSE